ncbi:MAG: hypothetical protein Q7K38_02440 [Candidatus Wildermuthbacteria bacterium]|nr:hypothetical protein [Candidatus Wildermuthbacteria bacterium]
MKVKAAITEGAPEALMQAIDSPATARQIFALLARDLRVKQKDLGPATHYMQRSDRTIQAWPGKLGCEMRVSGVSVTPHRAPVDFWNAVDDLHKFLKSLIVRTAPKGTKIQLFVAIMLDSPIRDPQNQMTTLLESTSEWVEGQLSKPTPKASR